MVNVAVLGSDGMLGKVLSRFLSESGFTVLEVNRGGRPTVKGNSFYNFDPIRDDYENLFSNLNGSELVINSLGRIKHRIDERSLESIGEATLINSVFPRILSQWSCTHGVNVLQFGTDCIYSGATGGYCESDRDDATDIYGISKAAGEIEGKNTILIRSSFIGLNDKYRREFLDWALNHPPGSTISGYTNHYWNGLTTIHIAKIVKVLIQNWNEFSGTYHIIPEGTASKADRLEVIYEIFGIRDVDIRRIEAQDSVNRILGTNRISDVRKLWKLAGYDHIPDFNRMTQEFHDWSVQYGDYERR